MKAKDIAAIIENHYQKKNDGSPTCDGFVFGDPETQISGIITTFTVTAAVLMRAKELNANMIITHEPTFFLECRGDWAKRDAVFCRLRELAEENNVVIWRCHDMMHAAVPDDIYSGFLQRMDWQKYARPPIAKNAGGEHGMENFVRDFQDYYDIPKTTLRKLTEECQTKLEMPVIRISGDPDAVCQRVTVLVGGGSLGFGRMPDLPLLLMGEKQIDTIICGEIMELLLGTYMQDAAQFGLPCSMIVLGHERSEEWGMEYMQTWLSQKVPVPVSFVNAGEPFKYIG